MNRMDNSIMKDPKGYVELEDINKLISFCKKDRDKLLILTLFRTGRRVSEIVRCLKPSDIDFTNNLVNYTILKRRRPIKELKYTDPFLLIELKKYIDKKGIKEDDFIFHISRKHTWRIITDISNSSGVLTKSGKALTPKIFRHSFAVHGAKNTKTAEDLKLLQELLGHRFIQTTTHYLKYNPQHQKKLINNMFGDEEE